MVPHLSHLESLECESCQLGKHVRTSFPKSINSRAVSPFDVIHSDVWGPSRVPSLLGHRYYVTFIDDFSRCTWIFLIIAFVLEAFFAEMDLESSETCEGNDKQVEGDKYRRRSIGTKSRSQRVDALLHHMLSAELCQTQPSNTST
uniref:Two pore calcium channel protein 1 n=1 Tax=Cajanus cajan TaxID=3821 RepID=A0A151SF38_CAJCA|nr:Two pore calcium channel protein 1 [Cajanus cajan]